jgi:hypothetical protein
VKKVAVKKVVARKATAPKPVTKKPVAKKPVAGKVAKKSPASRKVTSKIVAPKVAARPAPGKSAARKPVVTKKMVAPKRSATAPIAHISPEEAVAHIQALLDAKHERVQQGPSWPDGGSPGMASNDAALHPPVTSEAGNDGRVKAPQRNEQSKRKG